MAVAVLALALVETVNAWIAPFRAPTDKDWSGAAARVRAEFRPGDLIVAAPAWADPVMRANLGDLLPLPVAGRMDEARFGRIWEISQRKAVAPETQGAHLAATSRHGALTVRRWEKKAARVRFDFLAEWRRIEMATRTADGIEIPCTATPDRFQCGAGGSLKPDLLEIDTSLRNGLAVEPIERATLVVSFPEATLGRELAVAAGLHSVWLSKSGDGAVNLRVLVDGRELGNLVSTSKSGWSRQAFDTSAFAGKAANVRFEITTDKAQARRLGFAAEARDP